MDKNTFWAVQLGKSTEAFYGRYQHPDDLQASLREIGQYCQNRGIKLTFVFPPTHTDLQGRVNDFGLTAEYARYKAEIKELGFPTYDFEVDNELTRSRDLFNDPYHGGDKIRNWVKKSVGRTGGTVMQSI